MGFGPHSLPKSVALDGGAMVMVGGVLYPLPALVTISSVTTPPETLASIFAVCDA